MSFLSAADVLKGFQICKWVYDNCIDRAGRADTRCSQFAKDVGKIHPALSRLLVALEDTFQLRDHGSPDSEPLRREAKELIDDCNATLQECREILNKNKGIRKDGSGFLDDVSWGLSTEERANELRHRIQLHTQKINIFMESIRLEQSNTVVDVIQEILAHTRELRGLSPETPLKPIPEWLDSRFREALGIDPPDIHIDIDNFPLEHGFEALNHHYKQSISVDLQSGNRTKEQYLELVKAHWILQTLTRGANFKALRPGSHYPRAVARLWQLISDQYKQPRLANFNEEDLRELDESFFLIWPIQKVPAPRLLTEPTWLEEKILEISLPRSPMVQKEDLLVFRRGPTILRLAHDIVPANGGLMQKSEKINTHIDRFIPLYAVPSSIAGSPALTIKICDGKETGGTDYELESETDMFNFQRAATGFEVVSDAKKVHWSLNQKKIKLVSKLLVNTGRMQLWYWNPLSSGKTLQSESLQRQDSGNTGSQLHSSNSSQGSHRTNSTIAKVVNGEDEASFSMIRSDSGETTVAVNTQPPPILIIYSAVKGGYAFLHLKLKPGLRIVEASCECRRSNESCRRTVIENIQSDSSRPFTVRRLAVSEAQLDHWDLSVFGLPEHPAFKDPKRVQPLKCDYLNLDFPSVADRKKFNSHLRLVLKHRDEAQNSFNRILQRVNVLGDRPDYTSTKQQSTNTAISRVSSISSADSSWTATSRVPTLPPSHSRISISPNFVSSIDTALDRRVGTISPKRP